VCEFEKHFEHIQVFVELSLICPNENIRSLQL
jgi:hypothetical protein